MATEEREYALLETRPRQLALSFRESRDKWKRKCQDAKAEVRSLRIRIRDLELSRSKWRDDAEMLQIEQQRLLAEVQRLESQLMLSAEAIAESEKKG